MMFLAEARLPHLISKNQNNENFILKGKISKKLFGIKKS